MAEEGFTWATYRYATATLGLCHRDLCLLEKALVHAPNGIKWLAYRVPLALIKAREKTNG